VEGITGLVILLGDAHGSVHLYNVTEMAVNGEGVPMHEQLMDVPTRLLIVDDDEKFCRLLHDYLHPFGYIVDVVHNGPEGLHRALTSSYGAIILDLMLPGMSGIDLLQKLRSRSRVPVLILSALSDEMDRIAGLEVGADDYLPKTFSSRELVARLRAVLRRTQGIRDDDHPPITIGGLSLDPGARLAAWNGSSLSLTPIEYEILLSLARSPGRVKTRERLLVEVADRDFAAVDRSIDVHVSSLRKKLGDDAKSPRLIETVRGVGYRLRIPGTEALQ
jgi:DNA-binding response OmpR family regulator